MSSHARDWYDPDTLNLLHSAYVEASEEFKAINRDRDLSGLDGVEIALAGAMLAAAGSGERDVEALKRHALAALAPWAASAEQTKI